MELRQLRYFVKVAETCNFSEAARALNITQSTLSQQIRQLEGELNAEFFTRDSHHVMLTEVGKEFLPSQNCICLYSAVYSGAILRRFRTLLAILLTRPAFRNRLGRPLVQLPAFELGFYRDSRHRHRIISATLPQQDKTLRNHWTIRSSCSHHNAYSPI